MSTLCKWKDHVKDYQGRLSEVQGVNIVKNEKHVVSCIAFSNLEPYRKIYEQLSCN